VCVGRAGSRAHPARRGLRLTKPPAALEQPREREPAQLVAEATRRGHDHAAQLHERLAAHADGAAASEQEQPQRLPLLAQAWPRQGLARQRGARGADRIEPVVLAAQPALASRSTAHLEHRLAPLTQVTGKAGAVVTGALERPDTGRPGVPLREAKRLRVAATIARDRPLRNHRPGRRLDEGERVLVPVHVDADHVVQLVCNHPIDPPASVRRVR
jgi:hypothetical protein